MTAKVEPRFRSFWHWSREGRGLRAWWHLGSRSCAHAQFVWWGSFCHASVEVNDESWKLSIALPPFAIWLVFDGFGLWKPRRLSAWQGRETWLTDEREARICIHDWTVRLTPWGRLNEWRADDPWWVRGVSFDLHRLLGRERYAIETLRSSPVVIPMPEGVYCGTANVRRQTWKRPLWFRRTHVSTEIVADRCVPHAGKGENSWDCGDDGLVSCSVAGEDVGTAVGHFVGCVLSRRQRYGMPSDEAMREARA